MSIHYLKKSTAGFTLIEMLVSLALYTIVITISVGSLLVLITGSSRGQAEQNIMTTLTFAMDSMTREIRTGSKYHCESPTSSPFSGQESFSARSCPSGDIDPNTGYHGVSFVEGGNSITGANTRIAYYFDSASRTIMRRVGNTTPVPIVSSGINVSRADFIVTGALPLSDTIKDTTQPTVKIIIEATESGSSGDTPFILQTTITQRELDI